MSTEIKICKDGRIWGQNNKEAGEHLGILTGRQPCIKKGRLKTHYWRTGSEWKKGHVPWIKGLRGINVGELNPNYRGGKIERICEFCGNKFYVIPARIKMGWGKFCSHKCKGEWQSINLIGIKSPGWRNGNTLLGVRIRGLMRYLQWRSDIFQRDNWTCQTCEQVGGKLHVHHIKPFAQILIENNITNIREAQLCKELWDTDNGVTLCVDCHWLTKKRGK